METYIKILSCNSIEDLMSLGLLDLLNEDNDYDLNNLKEQAIKHLISGYRRLHTNHEQLKSYNKFLKESFEQVKEEISKMKPTEEENQA